MRLAILFGWCLVPLGFCAYHYGPGQEKLRLDDVANALGVADRLAAAGDHEGAVAKYDDALALLPADRIGEIRRVRLERDKAWMNDGKLPEANLDLKSLAADLEKDATADPKLVADAREAVATSQYYATWLMKLEGLGRDDWEPEIESARQSYKLLAERSDADGDATAAAAHREDLEAAIRLERMEPGDLQGIPLPKQCQGCKSGQCKKPGGKKPGKQNKNQEKDSRKAGEGPPPDGSGS